jgi:serine/threonine protein kinase
LKPDNIMLLGDGRSIKMIDFGTARELNAPDKAEVLHGTRVFTDGYAPLEQTVGRPEPRSDLFALAATLFHLATGKVPHGFRAVFEVENLLKSQERPLPVERRWFFDLIHANLAGNPNDRYCSCREFKNDLKNRRITKQVVCPTCQAINPARFPYCDKCASPLTYFGPACSKCNRVQRLGSKFCIYCGNGLK